MADNTLPGDELPVASESVLPPLEESKPSLGPTVVAVLRPIASLKIAVSLFAMAIFLVLAGTLAQVHKDIWEVVRDYFRTPIAWIEWRVFFPKSFLMGTWLEGMSDIEPGRGFPFPGGWLIGTAMTINLLAAHAIRFKVQAKGHRLTSGLAVIAIGAALTTAVILWGSMQSGRENQLLQEWPSLRILWQLAQGLVAGCVLLGGCVMVFRRRAGVVLLHVGVLLIMYNELLVGVSSIEGQMSIREGDTVDYEHDIRAIELAVVDTSPKDHNQVTIVPLTEEGVGTRFLNRKGDDRVIGHPDLPFTIEIEKHLKNSQPPHNRPQPDTRYEGAGRFVEIDETRAGTGTDTGGQVDVATIEVVLRTADGDGANSEQKKIGRYIFSQHLKSQSIQIDGKTYEVTLRFKRTYVPYSLHLADVRFDKYIGTQTASNYSSDVRLVAFDGSVNRKVHIWMNNPLRFDGKTFYQSSVNRGEDGVEQTGLQVVTNTGWMIPYVACMIVGIGMFYQFSLAVIRFQKRRNRQTIAPATVNPPLKAPAVAELVKAIHSKQPSDASPDPSPENAAASDIDATGPPTRSWYQQPGNLVPLAVLLVPIAWILSAAQPPGTISNLPDIHAFGRLPVVFEGRVKPYDTLARNSLRVISGRNSYRDEQGRSQPAIRWLLDEITQSVDAGEHKVFRIESLDVLAVLELERRSGFRYSFNEIQKHVQPNQGEASEYTQQLQKAMDTPAEEMSQYQRKLRELHNRLQHFYSLRAAHVLLDTGPDTNISVSAETLENILRLRSLTSEGVNLPLAVPSAEHQWQSLALESLRAWTRQAALQWKVDSPGAVAQELVRRFAETRNPGFENLVEERALDTIVLQAQRQGLPGTPAELRMSIRVQMAKLDDKERDRLIGRIRDQEVGRLAQNVASVMVPIIGPQGLSNETPEAYRRLSTIFSAWETGENGTFDAEVDKLTQSYATNAPKDYQGWRAQFEHHFNNFEPFYLSIIFYVLVFLLVALSWLTKPEWFNRAAVWLVYLTFALHTYGLVSRIIISGRPPVTNLYSSAVFIGWAAVLAGIIIERVHRMGIGNVIASAAGFGTLLIAQNLAGDGDTFTVLVAVLDTQFWLATHVVCITEGYTSTYVAGLLGIVYILRGVCTPSLTDSVAKNLARAIYGTTCTAMFFSFVGTVLGGLWADDSWGRFWGWDPKENGALIIVLWNALVLHARWGGMIKDRGLAVLAVLGNITVSWSWFGVNELGVGLHSYGFTEGVMLALGIFCLSQLAIAAAGCLPKRLWWSHAAAARQRDKTA
jgi:ABC-type transport system involved in cytochrome c biogenesis permease subunit